jgi:hypothetical protein
MVVSKEIGTYQILMISGYSNPNQVAFVYFYEPGGAYIGYVGAIKSGVPLPANVQWANGVLNIYFHEAQFDPLLDTLRNERPVYVKFNTDLKWGSVGTGPEPTGEQEAPVTP